MNQLGFDDERITIGAMGFDPEYGIFGTNISLEIKGSGPFRNKRCSGDGNMEGSGLARWGIPAREETMLQTTLSPGRKTV